MAIGAASVAPAPSSTWTVAFRRSETLVALRYWLVAYLACESLSGVLGFEIRRALTGGANDLARPVHTGLRLGGIGLGVFALGDDDQRNKHHGQNQALHVGRPREEKENAQSTVGARRPSTPITEHRCGCRTDR